MKNDNPFTLTFGILPKEHISRMESMDMVTSTFSADHPVSQTYLIEGIRGSGKTVLMTSVMNALESKGDWIVVDLNAKVDLLTEFALRLRDACKSKKNLIPSSLKISIAGVSVGVDGTEVRQDNVGVIEQMLDVLKKKNKRVLIAIDEVMHNQNMKVFASQFQILIRKGYPLYLIMTGLYENVSAIQNDPALTFLLRSPRINLEPLSIFQVVQQYISSLGVDFDKATELANITKGYAFAFQALGMLYYEHGDEDELEVILTRLDGMLDEFVYRKIWESLSGVEKKIVKAMGDNPVFVKDVCEKSGVNSSSFSKYRERLMYKGIIKPTQHGQVELLLPRFSSVARVYV